jgi:hypothetical protein
MKTNKLKSGLLMAAIVLATTAMAQTTAKKKLAYVDRGNNTYTFNETNGVLHEYVETNWKSHRYEMKLVNGKPELLYVDGEKIAPADYGKYSEAIAGIRKQIKEDRAQAKRDQEQAARDQIQAKRDQEQAARDQTEAKLAQEQAARDQEEAKHDQEQAARDQEQAKRDREQAARDQEQAKRDQEQAARDQVQAKHDQEEAAEDQRQLKLMITDMVHDGIIPNEDALHSLRMNADVMVVNGKTMSDTVFQKYKEKYPRFAQHHNQGGSFNGLNINRD